MSTTTREDIDRAVEGRTVAREFLANVRANGSAEALRTFAPPAPVATAHAGAMAYASAPMLSTPPSASTSEAVQGLLRLRARALR